MRVTVREWRDRPAPFIGPHHLACPAYGPWPCLCAAIVPVWRSPWREALNTIRKAAWDQGMLPDEIAVNPDMYVIRQSMERERGGW